MGRKVSLGAVRVIFAPIHYAPGVLTKAEKKKGYLVRGLTERRTVELDPRVDFVETIIHELLHVRHPGWEEGKVIEETEKISKNMSWKDKAKLLRDVCSRAYIKGEEP